MIAVVDKTDYTYCAGIGNGNVYLMYEGDLSWCSRLNWRPNSEGRQHLFYDEVPRLALWAQGYVPASQPMDQFLPGFPVLWVIGVAWVVRFDTQQFPASMDELVGETVGKKPVVSDSHQAFGDNVKEKAPHELPSIQFHDFILVTVGAILPAEGYLIIFHDDQPFVGNRYALSVAPEVVEDLLWPGKGRFAVDHPIFASSHAESLLGIAVRSYHPTAVQSLLELL